MRESLSSGGRTGNVSQWGRGGRALDGGWVIMIINQAKPVTPCPGSLFQTFPPSSAALITCPLPTCLPTYFVGSLLVLPCFRAQQRFRQLHLSLPAETAKSLRLQS